MRTVLVFLILLAAVTAASQGLPQRRRQTGQPTANAGAYNLPAVTFKGELKEITAKEIFIEAEDGQTVTIYRNRKTRFLDGDSAVDPKKIAAGTKLTLDVAKNPDGTLLAVNVLLAK